MKKVDSLYSILISSISEICDNFVKMEAYWNRLSDSETLLFDGLADKFSVEKNILVRCKRDLDIYRNYDSLKTYFEEFNNNFSNYPDFSYEKILFIIMLSEHIFQNSSVIRDEVIGIQMGFAEVDLGFECKAYASNVADATKNMIWFNPSSNDSLLKLVGFESDIECWYSILSCSDRIAFSNHKELLFCDKDHIDASAVPHDIIALLKLHMVSSGEKIIPSIDYVSLPSNTSIEQYCPGLSYSQFSDVIHILGEYNNRTDVLSKYLSIFHIIENFMFKSPIVKLERSTPGVMFSIRNFRQLYRSVDIAESKAIEVLFKKGFNLPFSGASFNDYAYSEWQSLITSRTTDLPDIEEFFKKISISDPLSVLQGNYANFFSRLVYQIRCSIVHNKETEFHISSENYPRGCRIILEEYLLRILEEFIFLLLSTENDLVWYQSDIITLWEKTA